MSKISDVAKEAGVSNATVSRYFNGGYLSEEKRIKVKEAIDKLSYRPNAIARALNMKSTKIIGFIIPSIMNSFFPELCKSVEDTMSKQGYNIMLCSAEGETEKEKEFINVLCSNQVDGIITATGNCGDTYSQIHIPVVSIDRQINTVGIHIGADNYKGGKLAAEHLYDCGCKKVVFIGALCESESQKSRRIGFLEKSNELSMNAVSIFTASEDVRGAIDGIILDLKNFDGIFAWNDNVAMEVLKAFHHAEIKIPQDIQLIGFDNTYISNVCIPSITTIAQNIYEMGRIAAQILIKRISEKEDFKKQVIVDVNLVKRETTLSPK